MCSMAESIFGWDSLESPAANIPVITFSPDRAAKVRGRINSCAAPVMMTCTRMPRSCNKRVISAALYAAIPPHTPRATFIQFSKFGRTVIKRRTSRQATGPQLLGSERVIQHVTGCFRCRLGNFRDDPLHFARPDFILCNPARLARMCVNHWRRSALQLPGAPCRHQYVAIIAVKSFNQFHCAPPATSVNPALLPEGMSLGWAVGVLANSASGSFLLSPTCPHLPRYQSCLSAVAFLPAE